MDPNDIELTMLLEGMAVEKNGKVHKVKKKYFSYDEVKTETVYFVSHELYNLIKNM